MNISLSTTKTITTADGASFPTRKDAMKHAIKLAQRARLEMLSFDITSAEADDRGNACYYTDNLAEFVARNADVILEALTVKQARKPRTPKDTPVSIAV